MRRKSRIKPWVKVLLFLILITLLSCFLYFKVFNKTNDSTKKNNNNSNNTKKVEKEKKKVYKLSMLMAGDALIHSNVYRDAQNADGSFNFEKQMIHVKDYLSKFDLLYYNQE